MSSGMRQPVEALRYKLPHKGNISAASLPYRHSILYPLKLRWRIPCIAFLLQPRLELVC
jgi:hypothetical protein